MAMTLPADSPAPQSPQSSDGSNGPSTPVSPSTVQTLALPPPVDATPKVEANSSAAAPAPAQPKRKPSRRANTAERRATHNAVERARRETLNGRFLDLAALLPNLSQIRRPSKSSIVNSSIAHIHASRRHRLLAARELRMLKLECDALRRELNEWRDRSGLPRVEEPVRGEGFQMILSGEVEILSAGPIEEEDGDEYGNDGYGDDDYVSQPPAVAPGMADGRHRESNPFAHNAPAPGHTGLHLQTILPRPANGAASSPMIVQSPTNVSFENPAMASMYDAPYGMQSFHMGGGGVLSRHAEPENKWGMYGGQQFTPPASSHGMQAPSYMINQHHHPHHVQRQAMYSAGQPTGHMYGSPIDNDDTSSVGSAGQSPVPGADSNMAIAAKRERSGSMGSVGSAGSHNAPSGSGYEMPAAAGMSRRMGPGAPGSWDESMTMNGGMPAMGPIGGLGVGGMGMGGRGAQAAMTVGGGGNVFAAMML
ncbi:uncharacterized protein PHACADRAFT_255141 [Phanerochaete carnosa HHB-10118-sp]|uniref:BHLH domain-containing protein n=1 Tax=Phanerochaete carnosa (strain HHB-10118-sp) TaxID=650164 RepID=K5WWU3_PHACS|nr:uncharacterized protein PHACADRAFT_255141 [Phanerochaete carnosa HHB-10118-sp]EKM54927.1 hypothetical protein PHACADRAFT_255141 [Phanerochaete carnosa HHB-10118-sp]